MKKIFLLLFVLFFSLLNNVYAGEYNDCDGVGREGFISVGGKCQCAKPGYKQFWAGDSGCKLDNESCIDKYGNNSKMEKNGVCGCNFGFSLIDGKCSTSNISCTNKYGFYSIPDFSNLGNCMCKDGYSFLNSNFISLSLYSNIKDECTEDNKVENNNDNGEGIKIILCGNNSILNSANQCECKTGYTWEDGSNDYNTNCIEEDTQEAFIIPSELCTNNFGPYSYSDGTIGSDGGYNCYCKKGFKFNNDSTQCIANIDSSIKKKLDKIVKNSSEKQIEKLLKTLEKYINNTKISEKLQNILGYLYETLLNKSTQILLDDIIKNQ